MELRQAALESMEGAPIDRAELASEDACLEAEGLRLVEERRKLKVDITLARHQRDLENAKAEALLAASREACSQAVEEAREAD